MPTKLPVAVWSDIACPWCFVGKAHLESAIRELRVEIPTLEVSVRWRAFELDPRPREPSTQDYVDRLANKYQRSREEAQQMIDNMASAIDQAGGHADFGKVIAANTFDAHRLIQWAGATDAEGETSDAQNRLTDAFMRGYLGDGINLGKNADMLRVVESVQLDQSTASEILDSQRYADTVRADEAEAQRYGIRAVPFFQIGGYGLSGAQPASTLIAAAKEVLSSRSP